MTSSLRILPRRWPVFAGGLCLFLVFSSAHARGLGHGYSHDGYTHGSGAYGHSGKAHEYSHDGHRYRSHVGPHQTATQFIDHILKFKTGMGITEEQEEQLRRIETDYKKTRIKMKAEVDLANLDLHELLKNDQSDLAEIESKLKAVHALKANLYMASIKARRAAKAVLTEEQRKRMEAVHERIQAYGSGEMHKGHPGGYRHHGKEKKPEQY